MLPHVKPLTPRVGVSAVSSPLEVGAERAPQAAQDLAALLRAAGCEVVAQPPLGSADQARAAGRAWAEAHVDAIALAAVSWFEDYLGLELLEECGAPLLLWPLPGMETGPCAEHSNSPVSCGTCTDRTRAYSGRWPAATSEGKPWHSCGPRRSTAACAGSGSVSLDSISVG